MLVRIANREDPDQNASSDLGLHCLPLPFFGGQQVFDILECLLYCFMNSCYKKGQIDISRIRLSIQGITFCIKLQKFCYQNLLLMSFLLIDRLVNTKVDSKNDYYSFISSFIFLPGNYYKISGFIM